MARKEKDSKAEEVGRIVEPPAPQPSEEKPATPVEPRNSKAEETDFEKTKNDMKAVLDAQSKVRVLVPLESGEKLGEFLPVNINGYRLNVPKGVYVDVPQTVADIISEAYNVYENNSATPMRADRNDDVQSALS